MQALILSAPEKIAPGEWSEPVCGPGDVIIRPLAIGVCAGDLHLFAGRNPYARYPVIGGHEICGEVVRVGAGVRRCRRGDRVVVEPVVGCGKCHPCRHGKPNCCVDFNLIGLHRPGGFAELCVAPEPNIHLVPVGLDPVVASFAEPLTIGLHACRRADVKAGELCLVLGAGPIGLAILEVARNRGARVVVTDLNDDRLAFARELGAETIKADDGLVAAIHALTSGEGAEIVIEATGSPRAIEQAVDLVVPGGRVVVVGLVKRGVGITLPGLDLTRKEINLLGARNSVGCFPEALALLASGTVKYPAIATLIPLWEAVPVFDRLHANPAALHKAVLIA